jgi:hypothetical protein
VISSVGVMQVPAPKRRVPPAVAGSGSATAGATTATDAALPSGLPPRAAH